MGLINLYGKCGKLEDCVRIFKEVRCNEQHYRSEIRIWNAMIKAYARNGDPQRGKTILNEMCRETELIPDSQIWKTLIIAFGHCGDTDGAKEMWTNDVPRNLKYDNAVITALVDCFGKKGMVREAHEFVRDYVEHGTENLAEDKAMWVSLLNA